MYNISKFLAGLRLIEMTMREQCVHTTKQKLLLELRKKFKKSYNIVAMKTSTHTSTS